MRPDTEPTIARRCAQIKQQIRLAKCEHPERYIRILLLESDGYIEYCTNCDKVLSTYEP